MTIRTPESLLPWIVDMEVWQEDDGRSVLTDRECFGLSDPIDEVTDQVAELEAAGLAVVVVGHAGSRFWRLTRAGERALSKAPKGQ